MTAGVLSGRCAIITGASRGLGLKIAESYLAAGANLMICARESEPLARALTSLQAAAASDQVVCALQTDVSQAEQAMRLTGESMRALGRIDILVNNAGIVGPIGAVTDVDWTAWVRTIEINLLGAVLMCRAVLPHLKHSERGKIIQLSGGGATQPMPQVSAYAASKAAVVRFVETLAEEMRPSSIDVNALAPGALDTRMLDQFIAAGPDAAGAALHARSLELKRQGGAPLTGAAELAVFLGSAQSDGITGKLISAVWDPWRQLSMRVEELRSTDVYTVRRILPQDRGLAWGVAD